MVEQQNDQLVDSRSLEINYDIQYDLPFVTSLSEKSINRKQLQISSASSDVEKPNQQQPKKPATGSVEYDFS